MAKEKIIKAIVMYYSDLKSLFESNVGVRRFNMVLQDLEVSLVVVNDTDDPTTGSLMNYNENKNFHSLKEYAELTPFEEENIYYLYVKRLPTLDTFDNALVHISNQKQTIKHLTENQIIENDDPVAVVNELLEKVEG